jgi:hypothetical protein
MGGCETWIVYLLNIGAAAFGCVIAPHRMWEAQRAARTARALYRQGVKAEDLLDLTLGELRERLGIPREGLATRRRAAATD